MKRPNIVKVPVTVGGAVDDNGKVILTTGHMHAAAVLMAGKISEQTTSDLFITWDAVKTGKLSALVIRSDIETDFTPEEISTFPIPGSVQKPDDKGSPVSANNPAKFVFYNEKTKKDETGDYYEDLIATTPFGSTLKTREKHLMESAQDAPVAKEAQAFKSMGQDEVAALLTDVRAEFKAYQNTFMKAVRVIMQERAFSELLEDTIAYEIMVDREGNYLTANKPIKIGENKKLGKSDVFSVTSFLAFDVPECVRKGGGYDALLKTLEREPNPPSLFSVKDFKSMEIAFSELASYLETVSGDEKLEKAFYNYLTKAGNGALVSSMFKVANMLDDVTVKPDLQKINNAVAA